MANIVSAADGQPLLKIEVNDELMPLISRYPERWATMSKLSEVGQNLLLYLYGNYETFATVSEPHFLEDYIIQYDLNMDSAATIVSMAAGIGIHLDWQRSRPDVDFYTRIQEMVRFEPELQQMGLSQRILANMTRAEFAGQLGIPESEIYDEWYDDRQFYLPQIIYQRGD